MLGIRGDSKTIAGWVNGHAQLKSKESTTASVQNLLRDWGRAVDPRQRVADWAIHTCREHHKEADSLAGTAIKGREKRMGGHRDGLV